MNQANQYRKGHAVEELKSLAAGRWFDILIAAGIDADKLNGKGHPCPKCGGRDRFAAFPNINGRGAVHCRHCFTRGTDPSPGDGITSLQWILGLDFRATLGWLADYLGCKPSQRINFRGPQRVIASDDRNATKEPATDFDDLAKRYFVEMSRERREGLAKRLNVHPRSLVRLRVGYSEQHQATTWPMVDSGGRCVGLRLRGHDGNNWSLKGGKAGLFVPDGIHTQMPTLFIAEGPTDAAALMTIGIPAIGRPSCTGAMPSTVNFVRRIEAKYVVLVADNDEAGIAGANILARLLVTVADVVRIITPGKLSEDCRSFVAGGGRKSDGDELVADAEGLCIAVRRRINNEIPADRNQRSWMNNQRNRSKV